MPMGDTIQVIGSQERDHVPTDENPSSALISIAVYTLFVALDALIT